MRENSFDNFERIVIIRLSSIGDIILTTPLIKAVRKKYPHANIDFVVKECYVDLVKTNPHLNNVIVFDQTRGFSELRKLKKHIKRERYDLLIDIHKNFRSIYLRMGSGAGTVLKYKKDTFKRSLLVWLGIDTFKTVIPVYERYFRAVEPLGIVSGNESTELNVPAETTNYIHSVLVNKGLSTNQPFVLICPGAGFATKRWYTEGFAAAGDFFARKYGALIGILGSQQDKEVCKTVQSLMVEKSVNFAGVFSLLDVAAVIRQSSLVVTNDTGLMHIAQTQNAAVVAVFGSTTREFGYYPFPEKSFVIEKDISCRPCTHNGRNSCPKKHFRCMMDISPDEVIEAADQLMSMTYSKITV